MKVLVVHNKYRFPGGEEESTRLETLSLRRRGHEVIEYHRDSSDLDSGGVWQMLRAACASFHSRRTEKDLEALVARHAPDVAHVHNVWPLISPSAYVVLDRLRVPIVQTMHNYRFLTADGLHVPGEPPWEHDGRAGSGSWASHLRRLVLSLSLVVHDRLGTMHRCIDRYVYLTEDGLEVFRRFGYDDAKASIKTNFVETSTLRPAATYDDTIVYLGRLAPEKGVHVLLEAMRVLPDVRLAIIGSGPEEQSLHRMQREYGLDNVRFLGSIAGDERFELLSRARLAVIPSCFREPQGRVGLEAASCGVPVIASRIGGLQCTIVENETGVLVPPGDSVALANAIRALYHDEPRLRRMRSSTRAWAVRFAGEESNYDALMRIYSLAIEQRRARLLAPTRETWVRAG
jgi:glycosyltransferase involved in cell wall biosynthesis